MEAEARRGSWSRNGDEGLAASLREVGRCSLRAALASCPRGPSASGQSPRPPRLCSPRISIPSRHKASRGGQRTGRPAGCPVLVGGAQGFQCHGGHELLSPPPADPHEHLKPRWGYANFQMQPDAPRAGMWALRKALWCLPYKSAMCSWQHSGLCLAGDEPRLLPPSLNPEVSPVDSGISSPGCSVSTQARTRGCLRALPTCHTQRLPPDSSSWPSVPLGTPWTALLVSRAWHSVGSLLSLSCLILLLGGIDKQVCSGHLWTVGVPVAEQGGPDLLGR